MMYSVHLVVYPSVLFPPVPSSPLHFTAHSLSSTTVLLTWSPPTVVSGGIRGYHITCVSLHLTINDTRSVFTTASEGNRYIFSNLEEDVLYRFSNHAENDAGSGERVFATAKTKPDSKQPLDRYCVPTYIFTIDAFCVYYFAYACIPF